MDTYSLHLMMDIWLNDALTPGIVDAIERVIRTDLTVLDALSYRFEPQGETRLFVLSESHFSLHTYPEERYLSLDCYVCNPRIDIEAIGDRILAELDVAHVERRSVARGVRASVLDSANRGR